MKRENIPLWISDDGVRAVCTTVIYVNCAHTRWNFAAACDVGRPSNRFRSLMENCRWIKYNSNERAHRQSKKLIGQRPRERRAKRWWAMFEVIHSHSHEFRTSTSRKREKREEKSTTTNIWHSQTEWISFFPIIDVTAKFIHPLSLSPTSSLTDNDDCDEQQQQRWTRFRPYQPNLQASIEMMRIEKVMNFRVLHGQNRGRERELNVRNQKSMRMPSKWIGNCLHLFSLLNFHFIYIYISTFHTHVCSVERRRKKFISSIYVCVGGGEREKKKMTFGWGKICWKTC